MKVTLFSVVSEKWDVTVKSYLVKILQIAVGAVDLLLLRETLTDDSLRTISIYSGKKSEFKV